MAFEVFDDVAFYYLCTSLLSVFVVPASLYKLWKLISSMQSKDSVDKIDIKNYTAEKNVKVEIREAGYKKYLTPSNILLAVGWLLFALMIYQIPSYEGEALLDFLPYEILEVAEDADENTIKKAYRKMSLKYHPDKNPDNPEAEQNFVKVSKAYRALTDPATKENYQKYGNADGYQGASVTIGLPSFLTHKDNEVKVLLVYFLVMIVIPPMLVFSWWQKAKDVHEAGALTDTVKIYYHFINENMQARHLVEILAASKEHMPLGEKLGIDLSGGTPTIVHKGEAEVEFVKLYKQLQDKMKLSKKLGKTKYILIANTLLHAYMMRRPVAPCLQELLAFVLKDAHKLLGVAFDVCVAKNHFKAGIACIELMQLISQAMWFSESPLLQLPYITEKDAINAKKLKIKDLQQFKLADEAMKKKAFGLEDSQLAEIDRVARNLPDMGLSSKVEVEDDEKTDEVFEDDTVVAYITLKRGMFDEKTQRSHLTTDLGEDGIVAKNGLASGDLDDDESDDDEAVNALESKFEDEDVIEAEMEKADERERALLDGSLKTSKAANATKGSKGKMALTPFFPFDKYEKWCLLIWHRDRKGVPRLLKIMKVPAFVDETTVEFRMRMSDRGVFVYDVQARCDSYVGCDVISSFTVNVKKLSRTEQVRREKTIELSKEYGLDDDEDEMYVEPEGVWYFLYFASFWEMVLNIAVLGALAFVGHNFLKTRGYWDKYCQPPIDFVVDATSPVVNVVYEPVATVAGPVVGPVWGVVMAGWDAFSSMVVPAEELNPKFKRNKNEHSEL